MKIFQSENNIQPDENVAALLMDVVPQVMNFIRSEMRRGRTAGLSIPQMRTLIFLYHHEDASLSQVAERIGLKPPSTSKLVDALVERKLVVRRSSQDDRRCIKLKLSSSGLSEMIRARRSTEARLSEVLSSLKPEQQGKLVAALKYMRILFTGKGTVQADDNGNDATSQVR